jgi:hypothetical protein
MTPNVNRTGIFVAAQPAVYTFSFGHDGPVGSASGIIDSRDIDGVTSRISHAVGAAYSAIAISIIVIIAALMDRMSLS